MNILAIDHGTKNIGLAWADTALNLVLPFGIIDAKNWQSELVKLVETEKIDKVVVGLPLGLKGEENVNTKKIRQFGNELKKYIGLPIEFVDERFSSYAADRFEGGVSRDEKSAMIILQSYLDSIKQKNNKTKKQ